MANHVLPKDYHKEILAFPIWHTHAQASQAGGNRKTLDIQVGRQRYRVTFNGKGVYIGQSLVKAVAKYNEVYV